jgi:hypothetical protein
VLNCLPTGNSDSINYFRLIDTQRESLKGCLVEYAKSEVESYGVSDEWNFELWNFPLRIRLAVESQSVYVVTPTMSFQSWLVRD